MRKRVGIFGGAFNPPHKGHTAICSYLLKNNDVDEIWVIPCFKHPFNKEMAPYSDRMTMCRFSFAEFGGRVTVSDIEQKIDGPSYTIKTIEHIQAHYPDYKLYLIMGSDTAEEMPDWRDSARIRSLIQSITLPRGGSSPIPDISSTDIRERIRKGEKFTDLVSKEVAVYIITHGLYS